MPRGRKTVTPGHKKVTPRAQKGAPGAQKGAPGGAGLIPSVVQRHIFSSRGGHVWRAHQTLRYFPSFVCRARSVGARPS